MKALTPLGLLLILTTSSVALGQEASNRFHGKVRGLANIAAVTPDDNAARLQALPFRPNVQLTVYVPGPGRVRFHLDRERIFKARPTFSDGTSTWLDPIKVRLLRGRAAAKGSETPAAAAIYRDHGVQRLFLNFPSPFSKGRGAAHYELSIPLQTVGAQRTAHVRRTSRFAPALKFENDTARAPEPAASPRPAYSAGPSANSSSIIEINVDGDAAWARVYGSNSNARIISALNTAETYYAAQLGISYEVVRVNVSSSLNFGSYIDPDFLYAYREYTIPQSYYRSADVHAVFSGIDPQDDPVIGLAFFQTICVNPSYSFLALRETGGMEGVVFAHELGHSFAAEHDPFDSPHIMAPALGLPPPTTFSPDSIAAITSHVRDYGLCLTAGTAPTPTPSPRPSSTPTPRPSSPPSATSTPRPGATPTPTSTRSPGGGSGSLPTPGEGIPVELTTHLTPKGIFGATVVLQEARPECLVRLVGSTQLYRTPTGRTLLTFAPEAASQELSVSIKAKVRDTRAGRQQNVYVAARIDCPDGTGGISNAARVAPGRIKAKKTIGAVQWLRMLATALEAQR